MAERKRTVAKGSAQWFGREAGFKAVEGADRTFQFTASDETVDRSGDVIFQDGWDLANFKRNPVVQYSAGWGHAQSNAQTPVGQVVKMWIESENGVKALKVQVRIDDVSELDKDVHGKLLAETLRAVSVGFIARKTAWVTTAERSGVDFLEQELAEITICPVPANANALAEARTKAFGAEKGTAMNEDQIRAIIQAELKSFGGVIEATILKAFDPGAIVKPSAKEFEKALEAAGFTADQVAKAVKAAEASHVMHPDVAKCVAKAHGNLSKAIAMHNEGQGATSTPDDDGDEPDEKSLADINAKLDETIQRLTGRLSAATA